MRLLLIGGWFLLPLLYWPDVAEFSNTPRWIFLSLLLPTLLVLRPTGRVSLAHIAGLGFLLWAALSLAWGPLYEGADRLAHWVILGCAFWIGSKLDRGTFRYASLAFAAAVVLQAPLVAAQSYLPEAVAFIYQSAKPAGLFANSNYLGETAAVSAVVAITVAAGTGRRIVGLVVRGGATVSASIVLFAKSGGGVLGLCTAALFYLWGRHRGAAVLALCGIISLGSYYYRSITIEDGIQVGRYDTIDARLSLAANSLAAIKNRPFGYGVGSYWSVYPQFHNVVRDTHRQVYGPGVRPKTAHNDALTILVELGLPGFAFIAFILWSALRVKLKERYILVCILGSSMVGFPFFVPGTAAMAALTAGFLVGISSRMSNQHIAWKDGPQ